MVLLDEFQINALANLSVGLMIFLLGVSYSYEWTIRKYCIGRRMRIYADECEKHTT